jgi:hypothetical protein
MVSSRCPRVRGPEIPKPPHGRRELIAHRGAEADSVADSLDEAKAAFRAAGEAPNKTICKP